MSGKDPPDVSVIIPVFNQPMELEQCLDALAGQSYERERFEVIVVDNGSTPPVNEIVERLSFTRCESEPTPGSYAARNRGIERARGTVLAFTDADCRPQPDWLRNGVDAVRNLPGPGMVAGGIELTFRDPERLTAAELVERTFGFPQEMYVEWGFSATANLFTSRETIDRVGTFDGALMSGGDAEWGHRVRARGFSQVFAADARVTHPARSSLIALCRKSARVAGGLQKLADSEGRGTSGLLLHARQELVQLWRIRGGLSDPRLEGLTDKLKFSMAVWLVELVRTLERYRVHYGGSARRT